MSSRSRVAQYVDAIELMAATRAPSIVWAAMWQGMLRRRQRRVYSAEKWKFEQGNSRREVTQDWFTRNIPWWKDVFSRCQVDFSGKHQFLEIGSYEGLSSSFILETFPNSTLTCVDTWEGADEHAKIDMRKVEARFDLNTQQFQSRLIKFKGTSFAFYGANDVRKEMFDAVYVDGSHLGDDVLIDALRCFSMLKQNGILIFDDYWWPGYRESDEGPTAAINAFIRLKRNSVRILAVYSQLALMKTKSMSYRTTGYVEGQ